MVKEMKEEQIMLRTLLVDDDFLVRSYLKTLDSWEKEGFQVVKDVRDGEEALCVLEEENIDVVITDISMPLMDGIELIRHIREFDKQMHIVVLSCHDDFEYVKEAMRLGADEYVLKNTLDEASLSDLLEKSRRQIVCRMEMKQQQEHTRKLIQMGSHTLKYHFFNGILSGTLSGKEREHKRVEAGIGGRFQNSAVIAMFMQEFPQQKDDWSTLDAEQFSHRFRHELTAEIENLLQEDRECAEIIYLGAGIFCCFLDLSAFRRSSVMRQRLMHVASACFQYCKGEPFSFGISVSSICMGQDGIRQAYWQAREMMKHSFYDARDILYYECSRELSDKMPRAAELLYERMEILLNGRKQQELEQELNQITEACERERTDGKVVLQWLKKLDKRAGLSRPAEVYGEIRNLEQLKGLLRQYSQEVFGAQRRQVPQGVSKAVRHALEFIHNNYRQQISLQDAADAAGVNAAYLSYLFKQEMEIGFSNYLQDCRMECAREMLCSTNCKIKEVAAEAGFNDYHYFSKTFKKLNELSPADYRREYGR